MPNDGWIGLEADYGVTPEQLVAMSDTWHYGWTWQGPENTACPCKRAECGLIATVHPACARHKPTYGAAKQLHKAKECPA